MNKVLVGDRAAKLVALADNMKKFGPAYSRLPTNVQERERKLSSSLNRELIDRSEDFAQSSFDINRSYGL